MDLKHRFAWFEKEAKNSVSVNFDIYPPCNVHTYEFWLSAPGIANQQISFTSVPGEYLQDSHYIQVLRELVAKSQIVMIVIDAPHLVEDIDSELGYGKYHDSYNRTKEVTHLLKTDLQNSNSPHMVIFVSVKCEKYYHQNSIDSQSLGMGMVNTMVKNGYRELIDFLTQRDVKKYCTTTITPVLTMGGIEFFEFNDHSYTGLYSFVLDPNLRNFSPKYCEQPLLLILLDTISRAMLKKGSHSIRALFNRTKIGQLQQYKRKLVEFVEKDPVSGFEILNDPFRLIS